MAFSVTMQLLNREPIPKHPDLSTSLMNLLSFLHIRTNIHAFESQSNYIASSYPKGPPLSPAVAQVRDPSRCGAG